jgi:glucoamylase
VPVTITSPAANSDQSGDTLVSGSAAPGATVVVSAVDTDVPVRSTPVTTTADGSGAWSARVPVAFGTNVITAAASNAADSATGVARVTVTGQLAGGTTVLDVTDPAGDDNGPGTYQYPTAADFKPGSFDITRFEVLTQNGTVFVRTTLRTLTPTFGPTLGAQLLDVYVRQPGASPTSTAAAYPQRNYTVADGWSQRIEVQAFASPQWQKADGTPAGTVSGVTASESARTITIALPAAQFGNPGSGWTFTVALTGQDGFSADQARSFASTPQPYNFGVCPAGDGDPFCSVDPGHVAKVMDTVPPAGVSQAGEWNLATGSAALRGVSVP